MSLGTYALIWSACIVACGLIVIRDLNRSPAFSGTYSGTKRK